MLPAPTLPFALNISHTSPDTTLQRVLDNIDDEDLVTGALGPDGVQGVIERWAQRSRSWQSCSLDLIGHSRRGVLQIGDWSVDDNGASRRLMQACSKHFKSLGLSEIRLLGCNTVSTDDGKAAVTALSEIFRVPVKGTNAPISARDFSGQGFRPLRLLDDHLHQPVMTAEVAAKLAAEMAAKLAALPAAANEWLTHFNTDGGGTIADLRGKLRRESLSDATHDWSRTRPRLRWPIRQISHGDLDALLEHAVPRLAHVPGLLALPEIELVVSIEDELGAPRYHRVTLLLDGSWIRMYPRGQADGVVLCTRESVLDTAARMGSELLRY